jgi:hypothetical protein
MTRAARKAQQQPPTKSVRVIHRVVDIRNGARPIDNSSSPAARYLQRLQPTLDLASLDPGCVREHPHLAHWASRAGVLPALVLCARRSEAEKAYAFDCLFLTEDGALAPLVSPRLFCGTYDGSFVTLREGAGEGTYLCETFETALALCALNVRGRIAYGLKRKNMPLVRLPRYEPCICIFDPPKGVDDNARAIVSELRMQGIGAEAQSAPDAIDMALKGKSQDSRFEGFEL